MTDTRPLVVWNVQRLLRARGSALARALGATSTEGWDTVAYRAKVNAVGAVLRAATAGERPALLALVEIEDAPTVRDVCRAAGWRQLVNVVPPDERVTGYDVALAYDPDVFSAVVEAESWTINNRFSTRDVLTARLRRHGGGEVVICHVHWASRTIADAEPLRIAAGAFCGGIVERTLKFQRDELFDKRGRARLPPIAEQERLWNTPLIVLGDFNDEPWNASLKAVAATTRDADEAIERPRFPLVSSGRAGIARYLELHPRLYNAAWELLTGPGPFGTVRFGGSWEVLDQVLVSAGALNGPRPLYERGSLHVFAPHTVPRRGGQQVALRTRGGEPLSFDRARLRGVSDHLPLIGALNV